jgi:hypothetical protein
MLPAFEIMIQIALQEENDDADKSEAADGIQSR